MQEALGTVYPFVSEGFRLILRVQSVYSLIYRCFLLKLSPHLQPFILYFPARLYLFLGGLYL